jgi:hypothetical protein
VCCIAQDSCLLGPWCWGYSYSLPHFTLRSHSLANETDIRFSRFLSHACEDSRFLTWRNCHRRMPGHAVGCKLPAFWTGTWQLRVSLRHTKSRVIRVQYFCYVLARLHIVPYLRGLVNTHVSRLPLPFGIMVDYHHYIWPIRYRFWWFFSSTF